ncbi:MAG: inositol monophosphatase family protein [Verrucomicrobiota bacterium]
MKEPLETAVQAAREAGAMLRSRFGGELKVDEASQYDIKLAIDVESQTLITGILLGAFPEHALYGEEGLAGDQGSPWQWIVDPIDGTVNYFYGIPHFCVSIALRHQGELILGVIYDPMLDELWTVKAGAATLLNGQPTTCSPRTEMAESLVTIGFSKSRKSIDEGMKRFDRVVRAVRKNRMLGSAALALTYIATGRLDAYVEEQISLWDVAAGKLMVEQSGGRCDLIPLPGQPDKYRIIATNGQIPIDELL